MSFLAGMVNGTTGRSGLVVPTTFTLKTSSTNNQTSTSSITAVDNNSGTNTVPVTVVNPTLGSVSSFTPFCSPQGYWSYSANATIGDGSTIYPTNAALVTSTGDFTWEAYITRNTTSSAVMCLANTSTAGQAILRVTGDTAANILGLFSYTGSAFATALKGGQWAHFAIVRASSTISVYLNGRLLMPPVTGNNTSFSFTGSGALIGGANNSVTNQEWIGNISNLRITIGTAVYTGQFIPSNAPLTTLANTKLLMFCGPSHLDYSGSGTTFTYSTTATYSARISQANPFTTTQSFVPASDIGSLANISRAGAATTMTYITLNSAPAAIGASDWTAEGWFYFTSNVAAASFMSCWINGNNGASSWALSQGGGGAGSSAGDQTKLRIVTNAGGVSDVNFGAQGTLPLNSWVHVAVCRSGGTLRLYSNGVQVFTTSGGPGTGTYANNPTLTLFNYSNAGSNQCNGYAYNVRYMIGTAAYTGTTYTIPTGPLAATGSTAMFNFRNPGLYDGTGNAGIITAGDTTRLTTATAAYGTTSVSLPNAGDYLLLTNPRAAFQFGNGDFTVEGWINWTNADSTLFYIIDGRNPSQTSGWNLSRSAANKLVWSNGTGTAGAILTSTANLDVMNTWTHVAYCRTAGVGRLFINGVLDSSVTDTTVYDISSYYAYIGAGSNAVSQMNGNVQGFRVSKFGRYTANFTPPTNI